MKVYLNVVELYPVISLSRLDDENSWIHEGDSEYEVSDELYDLYVASRKISNEVAVQLKLIYESKGKKLF